jgi:predicted GIY-YIG superfamily endonuclease
MHWVYILRCDDGSLYVGETADLEDRLRRHHDGCACHYTASRRPITLVYSEAYETSEAAFRRERQLKRWTRAKKHALISGNLTLLKRL